MSAISIIRERFSQMGIQAKVASAIIFAVVLAIGSACYPQYLQRLQILEERQTQTAELVAEIISAKASQSLQASEFSEVQSVLSETVAKHSDILAVSIKQVTEGVVAEATAKSGTAGSPVHSLSMSQRDMLAAAQDGGRIVDHLFVFKTPIVAVENGEYLGSVTLLRDIAPAISDVRKDQALSSLKSATAGLVAMIVLLWMIGRTISKPVLAVGTAMDRIAEHDYEAEIPCVNRGDEIGQMAQRLAFFRDQLDEEEKLREMREEEDVKRRDLVHQLGQGLADLADGRVDRSIDIQQFESGTEGIEIINDFNKVVLNLRQILSTATRTAESVRNSSEEIAEVVIDQSKRSEAQAVTLEESAAAIETLFGSVEQTAANAADAKKRILENREQAQSGGDVVEQTVQAMKNIETSSNQITAIIGVIDDIAFQTNLLALNAGVEAARAGEAGRGFAVVASEVRALAQRASSSANEIKDLITRSGEQVTSGSRLVNEAGGALHDIIDGINHASDLVSQIATSSRAQADNLAEIKESVRDLDRVTQRNAAMIEESSAASRSLSDEARRLSTTLQVFTLTEGADAEVLQTWEDDIAEEADETTLPVQVTEETRPKVQAPVAEIKPTVQEDASTYRPAQAVNDADAWADF